MYKTKTNKELKEIRWKFHHLAASSPVECDHIYDEMHNIDLELIERYAKSIPNSEKYIVDWKNSIIEVFFDSIHSKKIELKKVLR